MLNRISVLLGAATTTASSLPAPTAGFLYSYELTDPTKFEAGYKDHLEWHKTKRDHLVWYGWRVVAGSRVGAFVDGTFGAPFDAIDRRPDLKGDAAHFAEHVGPYGKPIDYEVFALMPAASTNFSLEQREPSAMLDVYYIEPRADAADEFELTLTALAARGRGRGTKALTWYRGLVGTELPLYLLLVPRSNWADLSNRKGAFPNWIAAQYGGSPADGTKLGLAIAKVRSEVWLYRADLSYFPEE